MKTLKHTLSAIFAVLASIVMLPAMADLPSGYRQLDYVDTDGNQWVNTLFRPTCTNAVEIKASVSNPSASQFLYCSRRNHTTTGRRQCSLYVNDKKARFDYQDVTASLYTFADGDTSPHVFFSSPSEGANQEGVGETSKAWTLNAFVDGVSVGSVAGKHFTPDATAYFCLFGSYDGSLTDSTIVGNLATCRFYYFKVWDTKDKANLLCHIVPVYGEAKQAAGLYDLVANRFLPVHGNPFVGTSTLTLSADEDWSNNESSIGGGITVDLNGNDLTVGTVAINTTSAFAGSGYQDLAYVLANGKQAVQITDFKLPGNAKVETMIRPSVISGTQWLFCSRAGTTSKTYSALVDGVGKMRFDFNNKQTTGDKVLVAGNDYELVFDGTTATPTWYVNETQENAHAATSNEFTGGSDLFLFGSNLAGTFSGLLYYFTVTVNDEVVLDLRPVRRLSDGVVGLYDTVNNNFYPSGTSTAFPPIGTTPVFANSSEDASELHVGSREIIPGYTHGAFDATEIGVNITFVKEGEGVFYGDGTTLAGTLKPGAGSISGLTLLDGATLDVSGLSGAFSLDDNAISFADSAKIYINVGSRTVTKNTALVSWTSAPANIGGLKFRLVAGGEEHSMLVKPDGLYRSPAGLILTFY